MKLARFFTLAGLLLAGILFVTASHSEERRIGDLVFGNPTLKIPPAGAPVMAGYVTIKNEGSEAEWLTGAQADLSASVQIHTMELQDGVMRMRPVEGGLEIPAGEAVVLKAGGLHLMFMKPVAGLEPGSSHEVVLMFEKAGEVPLEFVAKAAN